MQNCFGVNYRLVFDSNISENAYTDNATNTVHINANLENRLAPILIREYLGHVVGDNLTNNEINNIFNEIVCTSWYKAHVDDLRNAYIANDENYQSLLNEFDKASFYQREVVNKYVEHALDTLGNNNSELFIKYIFDNTSKVKSFLNRLLSKNKSIFDSDRTLNEFAKSISRFISTIENAHTNSILTKVINGEQLTKIEQRIENKYSEFFNKFERKYSKNITQISKSLKNNKRNIIIDFNEEADLEKILFQIKKVKTRHDLEGLVVLTNFDLNEIQKYIEFKINKKLPIVIKQKHLYSILNKNGFLADTNYHDLTPKMVLDALKSKNILGAFEKNGRYSFLKDIKDKANNPILVSFKFNSEEQNYILTMYGKELNKGFFENNKILFLSNKLKKGSQFSVQFRGELPFSDSNIKRNSEIVNSLNPFVANQAQLIKDTANQSIRKVISVVGSREVYKELENQISQDFGISLNNINQNAKTRKLFEDFNLLTQNPNLENSQKYVNDILNLNVDDTNNITLKDCLEAINVDTDKFLESYTNTLFKLLTERASESVTTKRINHLREYNQYLKDARDRVRASIRHLQSLN